MPAFQSKMPFLQVLLVENLTLSAGARDLLNGATWRLLPGERTGVVGVNGCGKTTLLRAVIGLTDVQSGSISFGSGTEVAYLEQTYVSVRLSNPLLNDVAIRMELICHQDVFHRKSLGVLQGSFWIYKECVGGGKVANGGHECSPRRATSRRGSSGERR